MSIKRTLKIAVVVICNPHRVLLSLSLATLSLCDWLIDKFDDVNRSARNWIEDKAENSPVFAKPIADSLVKESEELQRKKAAGSILPTNSRIDS